MAGKTVSLWLDDDTIEAIDDEASIQCVKKSKVVRDAMLRYAKENSIERAYRRDMDKARSMNYD